MLLAYLVVRAFVVLKDSRRPLLAFVLGIDEVTAWCLLLRMRLIIFFVWALRRSVIGVMPYLSLASWSLALMALSARRWKDSISLSAEAEVEAKIGALYWN